MSPTFDGRTDSIRILHVDDEPDFADMAGSFLERKDERFEVETATNAEAGREKLSREAFDCVVSDYDMPEQDGIEFLETVRESHPELPFILYTGKGSEEVASDAISAGVTDYLQKTTGTDQYAVLANRIRNAVERYRAEVARNRQRDAIETAQEGIAILNDDGEFIYVNQAYADLYGYDPDAMIGEHWELIYPDDDVAFARSEILGTVAEEGYWHGESTGLRADGSTFPEDHVVSRTTRGDLVCTVRDLSNRRQRETELNSKTRAMSEAPIGITLTDPSQDDNPLTYVNERFEEMTGYDRDDVLGRNCRFLQGERTDPEAVAELRDAVADERSTTVELRNYRADGTEFWNRVSIAPVRSDASDLTNYVGFQQDVTEQKEREEALAHAKRRLDLALQEARAGLWEWNLETDDLYWSDELLEYLGLSAADFDGQLSAFEQRLHPDDVDRVEKEMQYAIESREPYRVEQRLQNASGEYFWFDVRGQVVDMLGTEYMVGIGMDVTERKEREQELERLKVVLDTLPDGLALFDADLECRYVNDAFLEDAGLQREEYVGQSIDVLADFLPQETVGACTELVEQLTTGADRPSSRTVTVEDGRGASIDLTANRVASQSGEFLGIVLVIRDVTERLERQRALERQNERLEEFASVVSHDLRNPLTVASGQLELAKENCESERIEAVQQAHERMHALIDDLLELARQDETVMATEPVDLGTVIEECWSNVDTAGASVRIEIDRSINADVSRLKQVFENLFRNSIEHGGSDVTVIVGELEDGFYVADDGPGIPRDDRTAVFEAGHSEHPNGTGFGLSIVARIVDAHGWEIAVAESESGGARFEITGVGEDDFY